MDSGIAALLGVVIGVLLAGAAFGLWLRRSRNLAKTLLDQAQERQVADLQAVIDQLKTAFGALSREALSANSEEFLKLAGTKLSEQAKQGEATLEARKKLIDKTVEQITQRLTEVGRTLQTSDKERREAHGAIQKHLEATTTQTAALQKTTAQLREALANPQRRGQWGERMAEDVLRLAGFIEGVNYCKQSVTDSGSRPDFSFPLPQGLTVNMDVKFPLKNYLACLDAPGGPDGKEIGERYRSEFLRDVRSRIKEVTTRDYIDPDNGTVDYVLVFIPNEQVYAFIHQHDPNLLDDAMHRKVVLCSPLTLYAVLAVIRQAAEQFRLHQTSREILELLGAFNKQWRMFTDVLDKMGGRLADAMKQYELLSTTRTRQLDKQLIQIEALRTQQLEARETPESVT
ncbi:MAG: DNA recombination protein RmuC [Phycisphaerae bacterium]